MKKMLPRNFFQRDTKIVAYELLGKIIVHETSDGVMEGRIVETEAYYGSNDPASHASKGKTPRNSVMFGEPGIAYVYLNYGVHYLLNVVTEKVSVAGAVLIRSLEPFAGQELMFKNRKVDSILHLCNGPAKLSQAMGIDISYNGHDLTKKPLMIRNGSTKETIKTQRAPRIGISVAQTELLRYYIKNNPYVSKK